MASYFGKQYVFFLLAWLRINNLWKQFRWNQKCGGWKLRIAVALKRFHLHKGSSHRGQWPPGGTTNRQVSGLEVNRSQSQGPGWRCFPPGIFEDNSRLEIWVSRYTLNGSRASVRDSQGFHFSETAVLEGTWTIGRCSKCRKNWRDLEILGNLKTGPAPGHQQKDKDAEDSSQSKQKQGKCSWKTPWPMPLI